MSVGRLSTMLSVASTQFIAVVFLAGFLPGAKAWCQDDGDGVETCYGISNVGVYVLSIVGAIIFLSVVSSLVAIRRRRIYRENLARLQAAQVGRGVAVAGGPVLPTHNGDTTVTSVRTVTLEYYVPPPGAPGAAPPTK